MGGLSTVGASEGPGEDDVAGDAGAVAPQGALGIAVALAAAREKDLDGAQRAPGTGGGKTEGDEEDETECQEGES